LDDANPNPSAGRPIPGPAIQLYRSVFALINLGFFFSQLNSTAQPEPTRVDEAELVLTRNSLLYIGSDRLRRALAVPSDSKRLRDRRSRQ
jgi:hypothetical protein